MLILDLGHLFKDTNSLVLAWGADGVAFTTADAIANTNSTTASHVILDGIRRHTYCDR